MLADVVVALQRGEAAEGGGDTDGGETGMAGGGIRTAVVHGGTDGDASGHFIIQETADFEAQAGRNLCISGAVGCAGVRINAGREIAFELLDDPAGFVEIFGDYGE